jgi:DNA mismatch endonuclease, patch repair protein
MSRVGGKNTTPEIAVRRLVFGLGYRYRLHRNDLPGKPDIVLGPRKKVIFVHGCFWHGHRCRKAKVPKSNVSFWREKMTRNRSRDRKVGAGLRAQGWEILVIWQCELKDLLAVQHRIVDFLG